MLSRHVVSLQSPSEALRSFLPVHFEQEVDLSDALQGSPSALVVAASIGLAAVGDDSGTVALVDLSPSEPRLRASGQPLGGREGIAKLSVIRASAVAGTSSAQAFVLALGSDCSLAALSPVSGALAGGTGAVVRPKNHAVAVDLVGAPCPAAPLCANPLSDL